MPFSNLYIDRPDEEDIGLFGCMGSAVNPVGTIKNLGLENCGMSGYIDVGGLLGKNFGDIENCWVSGSITGYTYVGGLVGSSCDGEIRLCCVSGTVSGYQKTGGVLGFNASLLRDSYATADVEGTEYIGGLVGKNYSIDAYIRRCYAVGVVSGSWSVGGLVGLNDKGNEQDSFWNRETSGQTNSAAGLGLTTEEMLQKQTFSSHGWYVTDTDDPAAIWGIIEGVGYPYLRSMPYPAEDF